MALLHKVTDRDKLGMSGGVMMQFLSRTVTLQILNVTRNMYRL